MEGEGNGDRRSVRTTHCLGCRKDNGRSCCRRCVDGGCKDSRANGSAHHVCGCDSEARGDASHCRRSRKSCAVQCQSCGQTARCHAEGIGPASAAADKGLTIRSAHSAVGQYCRCDGNVGRNNGQRIALAARKRTARRTVGRGDGKVGDSGISRSS